MGNAVVQDYVRERDSHLNTINVLTVTAKERGNDPTDDDLETIGKLKIRIGKLDHLIDVLGDDLEMSDETRNKLARLQPGIMPIAPKYRSAGDLLFDCIHANFGSQHSVEDVEAGKRWGLVMKRAAEHMGTEAANTTPVAGGLGALTVSPVVGPVIDFYPSSQPLLTGIGVQPAPNSLSFKRPRIVDPNFKSGAGVQALEKAELVSKHFDMKVEDISLDTVGGYLNVSAQLLALIPTSLNIIISQLQRRVAYQGEAAAVAQLDTTAATVPLADFSDPAAVLNAIYTAAAMVYETTGSLPEWIAMGPQGWVGLGSMTDAAGRPLFPFLGPTNALGTSSADSFNLGPAGLRSIITPGISTQDLYVGNSAGLEVYRYNYPVMEAIEPSVLGRQVAVAQSLAFYQPITAEAGAGNVPPAERNGIVKIDVA